MKKSCTWQKIQSALGDLHLTDKCLLIFMALLMLQSAYSLFFPAVSTTTIDTLDVVIRTTAAAIFGYFISANFHLNKDTDSSAPLTGQSLDPDCLLPPPLHRNALQILVVSSIGIFALFILIIFHDVNRISNSSIGTLAQLRDFVSGSVGFLIGHPTSPKK